MTTPITGITSVTPELASLFEAVLTTIVRRKMGTTDDGTSIASQLEMKGTTYLNTGTLKRSNNMTGMSLDWLLLSSLLLVLEPQRHLILRVLMVFR